MAPEEPSVSVDQLLDTPDLAAALESDRFKQFLDQIPVAIAVSKLEPTEQVIYSNLAFEGLTNVSTDQISEAGWASIPGDAVGADPAVSLGQVVTDSRDYLGAFTIPRLGETVTVDAWSNIIDDDDGRPAFRLVVLVQTTGQAAAVMDELQQRVVEKDTQLRELQHRVKNNLQMITALIRIEARGVTDFSGGEGYDRLAGRVEALGLLYHALEGLGSGDAVDLGVYLSEIAAAVMRAHAVEGIHLNLQVDTWPVSVDVAMPAGLVVNELLTNALKHAFKGRDGGTITLHCITEGRGCRVVVADDGVGLPEGLTWPKPGKLSALIARSLVQNAKAVLDVQSEPGLGTRVSIFFNADDAAPTS
jgi:two-component sensor histidine kinase